MRILCIDKGGYALDWCMRSQADGHRVKWYVPQTPRTDHIGKGLIEIVSDWKEWLRWADLIFLPDNTRYIGELEAWRKANPDCAVVGATVASVPLELDRNEGMRVLKKHGVDILPGKEFTRYDDAIAYVKRENRRFVSKPCGDEPDKSLSYVSKSAADMVYMLERWKKGHRHKGSFIMQEFVGGTEMAVGGWIGPAGFNEGWCENWEFKKLMNGEKGVACFDETSEVLTDDGWKFWPDVTEDDEFCTLKDGKIVYDKPTQWVVADFDGELIGWKSETVDILVTPNHNMYVQDDRARKKFWFEPAEVTATKKRLVLRTGGDWQGVNDASALPSFYKGSMVAWAALVGAYIADGHCHHRSVVFGNCPPHKQADFCKIADDAGYSAKMYGRDLYINSVELVRHFRDFGNALQKRIPQYIKDATPEVISAFLSGYAAGDGSRRPTNLVYTTISRDLADDLQEALLKVGQVGTVSIRDRRNESHMLNGVECVNRHIAYDVSVAQEKKKSTLNPDICYRQEHKGKIYCVTVPSHVIYVRRNGKPYWIGQTGEQGTVLRVVKKSKLADKVLSPLEDYLVSTGHTGYVDVNCIIDEEGTPWPLEWTMRPGWPLFNIQQSLIEGDHAEWLADLAHGQKKQPFALNSVSTGVVLSIPDYPYSHITRKEVVGIPIYLNPKLMPSVSLCEAAMGMAPQEINGKIVNTPTLVTAGDYVLVAMGVGQTVRAARNKAYKVLDQIEIPNSPMYRTDIGNRLSKQLPLIQEHGFAAGMTF